MTKASLTFLIFFQVYLLCFKGCQCFYLHPTQSLSRDLRKSFLSPLFSKIKVKLLVDIKGQGKKGEIITVSPAMWTNVLSPKKQGKLISDEEIVEEQKLKESKEKILLSQAEEIANNVKELQGTRRLVVYNKVGASGQLFGTVTKKNILESLLSLLPTLKTIDSKLLSILFIKEASSENSSSSDLDEIRRVGIYSVGLSVHPKVSTQFELEVTPDKKNIK